METFMHQRLRTYDQWRRHENPKLRHLDWFHELDVRINKEKIHQSFFSNEELKRLSGSWVTCACGNQCSIIPRDCEGGPKDHKLNELGMEFYRAVEHGMWRSARDLLHEIEKRSIFLIQQVSEVDLYQPLLMTPMILL